MSVGLRVDLGSIQFNTGLLASNVYWYLDVLEGWDSPDRRLTLLQPTDAHGEVAVSDYYGSRTITVGGLCKATSVDAMWAAWYALDNLFANTLTTVTLSVVEGSTTRSCEVKLSSVMKKVLIGHAQFTFTIPLIAPSPFKSVSAGPAVPIGASTVINNAGNVQAWPIFTTTSEGSVELTNTDYGSVEFASRGVLPSGTVIDMGERTIIGPGDVDYAWKVSQSSGLWFPLLPGDNTLSSTGTASVEITFNYNYI